MFVTGKMSSVQRQARKFLKEIEMDEEKTKRRLNNDPVTSSNTFKSTTEGTAEADAEAGVGLDAKAEARDVHRVANVLESGTTQIRQTRLSSAETPRPETKSSFAGRETVPFSVKIKIIEDVFREKRKMNIENHVRTISPLIELLNLNHTNRLCISAIYCTLKMKTFYPICLLFNSYIYSLFT